MGVAGIYTLLKMCPANHAPQMTSIKKVSPTHRILLAEVRAKANTRSPSLSRPKVSLDEITRL